MNPPVNVQVSNTSSTTVDPGGLAIGTTYYWRGDSINNAGESEGEMDSN